MYVCRCYCGCCLDCSPPGPVVLLNRREALVGAWCRWLLLLERRDAIALIRILSCSISATARVNMDNPNFRKRFENYESVHQSAGDVDTK